jgi:hypothetical protein
MTSHDYDEIRSLNETTFAELSIEELEGRLHMEGGWDRSTARAVVRVRWRIHRFPHGPQSGSPDSRFRKPPVSSRTVGFPESGWRPWLSLAAFPSTLMFKCSFTYTPTLPVCGKTRCGPATSPQSRLNVLVGFGTHSRHGREPLRPRAALPLKEERLPLPRPALPGPHRYSRLMRQSRRLCHPLLIAPGVSLCRLPRAPAADGTFPTLSLQICLHMPGPLPRRLPWCSYPFLPTGQRPSRPYNPVGAPRHPYSNFRTAHFSRLQSFDDLQACRFARHPGCSHRSAAHWAAVAFTSPPISVRYLSEQGIC